MIVAIDESNSSTGPGLHVLAAVLVPLQVAGEVRAALRALLLPRQQRLHWTKESQQRRLKVPLLWAADALAGATLACATRSPRARAYAEILGVDTFREVA